MHFDNVVGTRFLVQSINILRDETVHLAELFQFSHGKVRLVGASNYLAWRLNEARWVSRVRGWTEFCCIQQRYSYVRPRAGTTFDPQIAANDDLLDYCRSQGVTLLAYSPLLSGAYVRADRPLDPQYQGPDTLARMAALRAVAREAHATPNQVILAWMLQSTPAVIPLVATSTTSHCTGEYSRANRKPTSVSGSPISATMMRLSVPPARAPVMP